jgi:hypothetical protein
MVRHLKFAFIALLALSIASTTVLHNHSLIPHAFTSSDHGGQVSQHFSPVCATCAIGADRIVLGLAALATPLLAFFILPIPEPRLIAAPLRRTRSPRGPPPSLLA